MGVIGRRRRASYAVVAVSKNPNAAVGLSHNLATNLRVRDTDKVKIVPLGREEGFSEATNGDTALLASKPSVASSVTFSPVRDSLHSLELSEGGDELSEEEISSRFVKPYLDGEGVVVLKRGHTLILRDANGRTLEFTVTHLGVGEEEEKAEEDGETMYLTVG